MIDYISRKQTLYSTPKVRDQDRMPGLVMDAMVGRRSKVGTCQEPGTIHHGSRTSAEKQDMLIQHIVDHDNGRVA